MAKTPFTWRQRLAFNLQARYVKTEAKLNALNYLFWECTSRCNISCKHCGSDCKIIPNIKDMPSEDFLNVLKQISTQYNPKDVMVVVSGGEPLVRTDLESVGAEISKLGFPWGMVSNGYAFTKSRWEGLLNAGIKSITVSLDGLKDSHDWLRGKNGSFERALNAIKLIAETPNFLFDVVTCVNNRNFNELEEIKSLLMDIGVTRWRLFVIDPIGRAKENPELSIDDKKFKYLMEFIAKNRKEGEIITSFGCDGFLGKYETHVRTGLFFCRAGIHAGSVLANGDISACPNIQRGFVQGNIYTDNFLDVWNTKFQQFRNRDGFKTGICKNCEVWKWCRGDGMHLHEPNNIEPLMCYYQKVKEK